MAENADSVVVELEARLGKFNADTKGAADGFDQNMGRIAASGTKAEAAVSQSFNKITHSGGQSRIAMLELQHVVRGSVDQFASGAPISQIFAQHVASVGQAGALAGGSLGKLRAFLAGPWGLALIAATAVLSTFLPKLLAAGDHTESLLKKMRDHARQARVNDEVTGIFGRTLDGLTQTLNDNTEALRKANAEGHTNAEVMLDQAKKALIALEIQKLFAQTLLDQAEAQRQLNLQRAQVNLDQKGVANPAIVAANAAGQAIQNAQTSLTKIDERIDIARRNITEWQATVSVEQGKIDADAVESIKRRYDGPGGLIAKATSRAIAEGKVGVELRKQTAELEKQRDIEIKAAQKHDHPGTGYEQIARFIMPVEGPITSGFGPRTPPTRGASAFHPAIDIGAPLGTPVKAAAAGVVITAGTMRGLGNVVVVDHGGGTITEYGHLSAMIAQRGQTVAQGDVIGRVGSTGISTGPHLDYRVRVGGKYVDPRKGQFPVDELAAGQRGIEEAKRDAAREQQFNAERAQLEQQVLTAQRGRVKSAEQQLQVDEHAVIVSRDRDNAAYLAGVDQGRISQVQADLLIAKRNELATAQTMGLYAEDGRRKAEVAAKLDEQRQAGTIAELQFEENNARTRDGRRMAQLALLDAEQKLERIRLQQIVDATAAGTAEHELALLKLDQLDAERGRRTADINRANRSPGQTYLDDLNTGMKNVNDTLQNLEVAKLKELEDVLAGSVAKALGLKGALADVVTELIRIGLQRALIQPIANLLFGGEGGGGGGGLGGLLRLIGIGGGGRSADLSGIYSGVPDLLLPGRASGGGVVAGRGYMVGENGPEPFFPNQSGTIMPNGARAARPGGGGGAFEVRVVPSPYFDVQVRKLTGPDIAAAAVGGASGGAILARRNLAVEQMHFLG